MFYTKGVFLYNEISSSFYAFKKDFDREFAINFSFLIVLLYKKILDIVRFVKNSLFKNFEELQDLDPMGTIGEIYFFAISRMLLSFSFCLFAFGFHFCSLWNTVKLPFCQVQQLFYRGCLEIILNYSEFWQK